MSFLLPLLGSVVGPAIEGVVHAVTGKGIGEAGISEAMPYTEGSGPGDLALPVGAEESTAFPSWAAPETITVYNMYAEGSIQQWWMQASSRNAISQGQIEYSFNVNDGSVWDPATLEMVLVVQLQNATGAGQGPFVTREFNGFGGLFSNIDTLINDSTVESLPATFSSVQQFVQKMALQKTFSKRALNSYARALMQYDNCGFGWPVRSMETYQLDTTNTTNQRIFRVPLQHFLRHQETMLTPGVKYTIRFTLAPGIAPVSVGVPGTAQIPFLVWRGPIQITEVIQDMQVTLNSYKLVDWYVQYRQYRLTETYNARVMQMKLGRPQEIFSSIGRPIITDVATPWAAESGTAASQTLWPLRTAQLNSSGPIDNRWWIVPIVNFPLQGPGGIGVQNFKMYMPGAVYVRRHYINNITFNADPLIDQFGDAWINDPLNWDQAIKRRVAEFNQLFLNESNFTLERLFNEHGMGTWNYLMSMYNKSDGAMRGQAEMLNLMLNGPNGLAVTQGAEDSANFSDYFDGQLRVDYYIKACPNDYPWKSLLASGQTPTITIYWVAANETGISFGPAMPTTTTILQPAFANTLNYGISN